MRLLVFEFMIISFKRVVEYLKALELFVDFVELLDRDGQLLGHRLAIRKQLLFLAN